jgi:hypothetical protein
MLNFNMPEKSLFQDRLIQQAFSQEEVTLVSSKWQMRTYSVITPADAIQFLKK